MCNKQIINDMINTNPSVRAAHVMMVNTGGTYEEMLEILVIHFSDVVESLQNKELERLLNT